jgi:thioredoxin reductase
VRDTPVATLATGPMSTHHTLLLRQWTDDLVYFLDGQPLADTDRAKLAARGVVIEERRVQRLIETAGRLRGVELADGSVIPRTTLFLVPQLRPNTTLLDALGCERDLVTGWPEVGPGGRTSVPGVWVAGNVADPTLGVIASAGAATTTAAQINAALVEADVEAALAAGPAA